MQFSLEVLEHQASRDHTSSARVLIDTAIDVPDHISLWGLLLAIRGPAQLYVNVRPVRLFPGLSVVIYREVL